MKQTTQFIPTMQPQYLPGGDVLKIHGGATYAEIKEDGYRVQMHKNGKEVTGYTRSGNALHLQLYPEITKAMQALPTCIIDAELVQGNKEGIAAFDGVKRRFRHKTSERSTAEYHSSSIIEQYPLELRAFDALSFQGKSLMQQPIERRRQYVEKMQSEYLRPSNSTLITCAKDLEQHFEHLTAKNYEGLVCKRPGSLYLPDSKTTEWIKLKRAEPLDVIIGGIYLENDRIGRILCCTYNTQTASYETIGIVNAKREGLDREIAQAIPKSAKSKMQPHALNIERLREMPDSFVDLNSSVVVELKAMQVQRGKNNFTCGIDKSGNAYSLRIGWLSRLRQDKRPTDIATNEEVAARFAAEQEAA